MCVCCRGVFLTLMPGFEDMPPEEVAADARLARRLLHA
jgi:hypothetical protein